MGKVVDFPSDEYGDEAITIENSQEFIAGSMVLSDYIVGLTLEREKNDHLIELIIKQISQAHCDAFSQGFSCGLYVANHSTDDDA